MTEARPEIIQELRDLRIADAVGKARHDRTAFAFDRPHARQHDVGEVARIRPADRRTETEIDPAIGRRPAALVAGRAGRGIDRCALRLRLRRRTGRCFRQHRFPPAIGRRRPQHLGHIDRDGADVAGRHLRKIAHPLGHRSARRAVVGMPAPMQIGIERARFPRHRRRRLRVERVGLPIVDIAAGEGGAGSLGAERVARGVARAAMRQALDQIGAAIPFRALCRIRLVGPAMQEQQLPTRDHDPLVEGKRELVLTRGRMYRLARHQVGVERAIVLVADIGEVIVGESRIKMPPFAIDA